MHRISHSEVLILNYLKFRNIGISFSSQSKSWILYLACCEWYIFFSIHLFKMKIKYTEENYFAGTQRILLWRCLHAQVLCLWRASEQQVGRPGCQNCSGSGGDGYVLDVAQLKWNRFSAVTTQSSCQITGRINCKLSLCQKNGCNLSLSPKHICTLLL